MRNFLIYLSMFFTFLISCSRAVNNEPQASVSEFVEIKSAQPDAILLDVRTSGEFTEGTISGAENIDVLKESFETEVQGLDKNQTVLVFCKSGGRSATAKQKLLDLGFTKVVDLEGGIKGWKAAGGEVVTP